MVLKKTRILDMESEVHGLCYSQIFALLCSLFCPGREKLKYIYCVCVLDTESKSIKYIP